MTALANFPTITCANVAGQLSVAPSGLYTVDTEPTDRKRNGINEFRESPWRIGGIIVILGKISIIKFLRFLENYYF